ncbi:MAG: hypothetical protein KAZ87_09285 [Spirochaetes bacterium]|nr:hypothetical protein [Spirochaetota bacterium]
MSIRMEFTKEQLEQIGSYIESNFDRFGAKSNVIQLRPYDIQLIERMTRIEEELKAQRELFLKQNETMQFGFNQMDKRFESMQKQMDARFDDVNKKFSMMMWMTSAGFTIIATVITLLTIFAR